MSKFKVGDRVRRSYDLLPGRVVAVTHGVTDSYEVLFEGYKFPPGCAVKTPGAGTYSGSVLQYVSKPFTLKVGTEIINNKTGRTGRVVTGQDNQLWVVDDSYLEDTGAPARAVEEYEEHFPGTYEIVSESEPF